MALHFCKLYENLPNATGKRTIDEKVKNYSNDILKASLKRGIKQSDNREVRPHDEVWPEIRTRYKKSIIL